MDNEQFIFRFAMVFGIVCAVLFSIYLIIQLPSDAGDAEVYSEDFVKGFTIGMFTQERIRELATDENGCFDNAKSILVVETIIGRIKNQDVNYLPLRATAEPVSIGEDEDEFFDYCSRGILKKCYYYNEFDIECFDYDGKLNTLTLCDGRIINNPAEPKPEEDVNRTILKGGKFRFNKFGGFDLISTKWISTERIAIIGKDAVYIHVPEENCDLGIKTLTEDFNTVTIVVEFVDCSKPQSQIKVLN